MPLKKVIFFNVNGSGMGHMNRCLSYAKRMQGRAECVFFSLASAIEVIEAMGFEADYFVSPYWSESTTFAWNSELAIRFGLVLERIRPDAVVFDGTWPFQGFLAACEAYRGSLKKVWSNRGFLKSSASQVSVPEELFDLIIVPGEIGSGFSNAAAGQVRRKVFVPPVTLLDDAEIADKPEARQVLGLPERGRFVLFSLGPGNLKDVSGVGHSLIRAFESSEYQVVWACPPISVRDVALPARVRPISVYPLVRYMRAFDAFVGAAGYNTCCEVVQVGIPTLLVPNAELADDQTRRAHLVAENGPVVVSSCETQSSLDEAITAVLKMSCRESAVAVPMDGAQLAAEAILDLVEGN